jgi:hypothetical protein
MRDVGRKLKLIETLNGKSCEVCGISEPHLLTWFPHHQKIKHNLLRFGKKTEEYAEAMGLMRDSFPVCVHCVMSREYHILIKEDTDPRWPH